MLKALVQKSGWLGLGIGVGQGVILLATPWLARNYSPSDFGALALILTASNVAAAIGSVRYDLAISSADDDEVAPLVILCAAFAVLSGALAGAIAFSITAVLPQNGVLDIIGDQWMLIAFCATLSSVFQTGSSLLLRRGSMALLAGLRIAQGMCFVALAVTSNMTLVWAHVLSLLPGLIMLTQLGPIKSHSLGRSQKVAKKYSDFPRHGLPGAMFDVIGYSVCIWVILQFYGSADAGEWSQVQRLVGAPMMLFSIAVGQVLLVQTAQNRERKGELRKLFVQIQLGVLALLVPLLLILSFRGQEIFKLVLGDAWNVESMFLVFLTTAIFVRASVSPLSSVLATYRRLDLGLRWQAAYFFSAILLFPWVASQASISEFVAFYAFHEAILYLIYLKIIMKTLED